MTSGREMTPPPGFLTLTPIPSSNELPPITVPTFIARTPKNTPLTNHASTSANPDPMISLAFVEADYEILKSLLRERREQIRNKDLRTELEYFSEDYDEEREIEPRLICIRETKPSSLYEASLILGFPSISLVTVGGRSGSLVGQGSTYNRVCGRECSSAVSVCPRMRTGAAEKILTCVFEISGAWPFITSLKCVLTQEYLDAICAKYFVPEEVHPQLPSFDATMHERPVDSVKNWNDHFFWVDEFVVPANARFSWFSGSNIVKDRAPAPSEYNVGHVNTLIAQAYPFLRFPKEFLCWVSISRNYLLNKDTYPRFEYENREEMDLNAFIRTADPCKMLTATSVAEEGILVMQSVGVGGRSRGFDSAVGQENVEPSVPVTDLVEAEVPKPNRSKKKRVIYDSEGLPVSSHPPKRLRADYGTAGGSVTGGKSLSALNRLLQDSRLTVEQGVLALPTLPFITSSVIASPLEEGGDRTDSVTGPSLRTIGPSARFVVLSDSSHHSGANSVGPEVDSLVKSAAPVMTEAISVATTVAIPADISKDKSAPHPSVFRSSSSSEKTDRTLSLFTGRSGSGFCHTPRRGLDETRVRRRDLIAHLKNLAQNLRKGIFTIQQAAAAQIHQQHNGITIGQKIIMCFRRERSSRRTLSTTHAQHVCASRIVKRQISMNVLGDGYLIEDNAGDISSLTTLEDQLQEAADMSAILTVVTLGMFYAVVAKTASNGEGQQSLHHL
ncbi:hypothetical protein Tco_1466354 [Tanacetum coccineum]